ncbi:PepSY-associated TM helix domain-containing protein [Actinoalloteichus hymeniacidonis]|uniref:Iron-regulated membrane protein n=1 Tax=Actinoalloteichus hymeniacidonis TaxID=340345 RepID=A0AAC9HTH1_9PSEU|nr:PepSY-associated TM helix domain-containing protein [Actinoalloteichus hymeniacidonis]AOS64205.1 hypothetical protein TL08_17025 [Actinoalloteichus hymeniacidonis]MBB5907727.1 putative iron-regulated membrane protein [Actinoalloteichus hymeniacidonis]
MDTEDSPTARADGAATGTTDPVRPETTGNGQPVRSTQRTAQSADPAAAEPADTPTVPRDASDTVSAASNGAGRSAWSYLRPLVLRLHFYAGVFVAPLLVIAAFTGLLYVFTPQLEQAIYDHELHVPAGQTVQPLADQVQAAQQARPDDELMAIRPGPTETDTTQVIFHAPDLAESYRRTVFVDPYTTEVRGVLETYGSGQALPVRGWIDWLHRGLHLGDFGRLYSELAASWLWLIVSVGVVLWVVRRRTGRRARAVLAPARGPAGRRRTMSWHGSVGVWAAAGLIALSATGLTWSTFAGENVGALRSMLSWETPAVSTELPAGTGSAAESSGASSGDIGVDQVRETALSEGLTGPLEITPPTEPGTAYKAQEVGRTWPTEQDGIAVAPGSGEVIDVVRFEDYSLAAKLARWGVDAHMGLLFGWVNQAVLVFLAVSLMAVIFWGYRMWWQRRPARGGGFVFGRPPTRGAWRRIPGRVLAPVILAGVFVAYFVPLLGASLLVFLLIDVLLGVRARRRGDPDRAAATGSEDLELGSTAAATADSVVPAQKSDRTPENTGGI